MKKWILFTLLALLLLTSCDRDESGENFALNNGIDPDMILRDVNYTLGQEGEKPLFLEANELVIYNDDNQVYATDIIFYQLGENNEKSLTGTAGYAIIDTDSKSASFSKGVNLDVIEDGMHIVCENLEFDTKKQTIESRDNVSAKKDNMTILAKGVLGNLLANTFEFEDIEKGEIVL